MLVLGSLTMLHRRTGRINSTIETIMRLASTFINRGDFKTTIHF